MPKKRQKYKKIGATRGAAPFLASCFIPKPGTRFVTRFYRNQSHSNTMTRASKAPKTFATMMLRSFF